MQATGDAQLVKCNRCGGPFKISNTLVAQFSHRTEDPLRGYLSAHLRQASGRGEDVTLGSNNWEAAAEGHAHTSVQKKLDMLLRLFCDRSGTLGRTVVLGADDFVWLDAADFIEANYLAEALL